MRVKDEKKEKAIRQKALEMVVKHGLDGLSMQKLAKAAGVSPATIYLYFENKEDLLIQLFIEESRKMTSATLHHFDPKGSFSEGLKRQWLNRAHYFMANPLQMQFLEQVRHSPMHEKTSKLMDPEFFKAMHDFVSNGIETHELAKMPVEVYWSVAYGPLYNLLKFHFAGKSMSGRSFTFTDEIMMETLELVLKALKP